MPLGYPWVSFGNPHAQKRRRETMMTDEETRALAERARTGDKKAREAIVSAYMPIAVKFASRYRASGLLKERDMEDVLSDAAYSICLAIDSWDPERSKFTTYVYIAARKALQDYVDGIRRFSGFSGGTHRKGSCYMPLAYAEDFRLRIGGDMPSMSDLSDEQTQNAKNSKDAENTDERASERFNSEGKSTEKGKDNPTTLSDHDH